VLAVLHPHILTAVLRVTSHFLLSHWRRQVKRVRCDQVKRKRLANLAAPVSYRKIAGLQIDIVILILAGEVNCGTRIEATKPRVSWAVVEDTEIASITWQRTGQCERSRLKINRHTK